MKFLDNNKINGNQAKDVLGLTSVQKRVLEILLLMGLITLAAGGVNGCGKKAMPVASSEFASLKISDLSGQLTDGELTLSWSLPDLQKHKFVTYDEIAVFRSKAFLKEGGCRNCPLRYELVARLPFQNQQTETMQYREKVEKGFHYTYKVVPTGKNNIVGQDSNIFNCLY